MPCSGCVQHATTTTTISTSSNNHHRPVAAHQRGRAATGRWVATARTEGARLCDCLTEQERGAALWVKGPGGLSQCAFAFPRGAA
eukprot:358614-Chlamydomonas_euryale.AAC.8